MSSVPNVRVVLYSDTVHVLHSPDFLLLVYKAMKGLLPKYLSNLLLPYEPSRLPQVFWDGSPSFSRVKTKHGEANQQNTVPTRFHYV